MVVKLQSFSEFIQAMQAAHAAKEANVETAPEAGTEETGAEQDDDTE